MLKMKLHGFIDFITQILPMFLLALNFMFYNALDLESLKTPIRMLSIVLLSVGWVCRGKYNLSHYELLFLTIIVLEFFANGLSIINLGAIVVFLICTTNNIKKIKGIFFGFSIILSAIMIIMLGLGIVDNFNYISSLGRARATMGFNNPNVAAIFYLSIVYSYLLKKEDTNFVNILASLAASIFIYYYSDSRTAIVAIFIFLILLTIYKVSNYCKLFLPLVCACIINFCFVLNLLSVFFINDLFLIDEL